MQRLLCLICLCSLTGAHAAKTLVAEWHFDGTTVSADGLYTGQPTAISYVAGVTGQAVSFNGSTSKVYYSANSAWTFTENQSFTIDFYLRTTQHPSPISTPVMARPGSEVDWSFVVGGDYVGYGREMGHVSFELWNWASDRVPSAAALNDGVWHHLVGCYYAPQRIAVYFVDGQLQGTMQTSGSYSGAPAPFNLGNNIGANQPFEGAMDEFKIYSGVDANLLDIFAFDDLTHSLSGSDVQSRYAQWVQRLVAIRPFPATNLAEWQVRRQVVRDSVLDALGLKPFPYTQSTRGDLLPLDPHLGAVQDKGDYTVQGIRIQTWENTYSYGFLYLPKTGSPPYPAILNPNGHFAYEARDPVEQSRAIGLAKKGFIALAVNSIHLENVPLKLTPLSAMIWTDMRFIDYLKSRPDVDPARIGCTGASGGGQQTFHLMCVDDDLAAAVPVVMPSFFKEIMIVMSGLHHYCNWVPGLLAATDCPEECAVFAPKPCLYISTSQDWTYHWPTQGLPEVSAVYGYFGAQSQVADAHDNLPHDYMQSRREKMYAFYLREFKGITDATAALEPPGLPILTNAEMLALLPAMPTAENMNVSLPREFAARLTPPDPPPPANAFAAQVFQESLREMLRTQIDRPIPAAFVPSASLVRSFVQDGYNVSVIQYRTEPEIIVPAVVLSRSSHPSPQPLLLLVTDTGKGLAYLQENALCRALLDLGCALLLPDVRYTGEIVSNDEWYKGYGTNLGRHEAGVAAQDLMQILRVLRAGGGYDAGRIVLVGIGNASIPALLADALDAQVFACAGLDVGLSYKEGRTRPYFNGAITLGDLPQLSLLALDRPLFWSGVHDASAYALAPSFASALGSNLFLSQTGTREDFVNWYQQIMQPAVVPTPTPTPVPGAPVWFAPEAMLLPAGSGAHPDALDLQHYVSDDDTPVGSLVFSLVSQSNPAVVQADVTSSGMLSATVQGSGQGASWIVLEARDAHGNASRTTLEMVVGGATGVPRRAWQGLR